MTPDTSIYMIAGFSAIFVGIIGYLVSLIFRTSNVQKRYLNLVTHHDKDKK
jgi:CcmD family protein